MPSTMVVPSMYWIISRVVDPRARHMLGRVDPADLDAQVAAVGEGQLGAIAARQSDLAGRDVGDRRCAVPPRTRSPFRLGAPGAGARSHRGAGVEQEELALTGERPAS